ncbi:putative sterile alpha motif domain-containing protein 3-like [Sesbania bispinosa]|nr:putative sterile alpha motif domain-containing protein 3-like [Sesbania bispinosa]
MGFNHKFPAALFPSDVKANFQRTQLNMEATTLVAISCKTPQLVNLIRRVEGGEKGEWRKRLQGWGRGST